MGGCLHHQVLLILLLVQRAAARVVPCAMARVRFAVGSDALPAGLLASTDQRPFGPPEIVDVWGEALIAFAWQMVLTTMTKLADAAGRDVDGAGLIPASLRATDAGIAVLTMARHSFDRRVQT